MGKGIYHRPKIISHPLPIATEGFGIALKAGAEIGEIKQGLAGNVKGRGEAFQEGGKLKIMGSV
jgi:hypothetical protein